eukprot:110976_1
MTLFAILLLQFTYILFCYGSQEYMTGINYFAGWWQPLPNKWHEPWNQSVDWRPLYPDRIPLTGNYNVQATMDAEIIAASNYSIDFFQILYYDNYPTEREPNSIYLNNGLKTFINSSQSHRMKFFIEWCNTYPLYKVNNMTEWKLIIQNDWMPAFKHPSYLKIDNKLIFKVINAAQLSQNCNGSEVCVETYLNYLRNIVKNETNYEMLIGGGIGAAQTVKNKTLYGYDYDFTGTYMDGPFNLYNAYQTYEWEIMSNWTIQQRKIHINDAIKYMPYLPVGWNPAPWNESRPFFEFPTNDEWINDLKQIKMDLDNNDMFRIGDQKIFHIYAWNEFGEGGIMAPTQKWKYQRLQGVQNVFG